VLEGNAQEANVYRQVADFRGEGARAVEGKCDAGAGWSQLMVGRVACCVWKSLECRVDDCFAKRDVDERGQSVAQ